LEERGLILRPVVRRASTLVDVGRQRLGLRHLLSVLIGDEVNERRLQVVAEAPRPRPAGRVQL
jgi:hypothetical protein